MKISLRWVRQLTEIEIDETELLRRIAAQIGEIEAVERLDDRYQKIVVAEIKEARKHPDADKLNIYMVDNGGPELVQVVGGGLEMKQVGDKVAHIQPGATVPSSVAAGKPFVIEARKLRGVLSNGMLGSAAELCLSDDHDGILTLDTNVAPGTSLVEAYELDDVIVEIENKALTHRPDMFGMLGVAREIAGIQHIAFKQPSWLNDGQMFPLGAKDLPLSVKNEVPDRCSRYTAVALSGISVRPSSLKLQSYLSRLGVKPINNVVDITNYMMLLTGQPLHAFDYDKVMEKSTKTVQIIIRKPEPEETIELLDGRTIQPHPDAVLICTDKQPIAVGGAMGGSETEVDDTTTSIILEAAHFDMYSLRRTSMIHGLFTEAVTRFIRNQDPHQCDYVSNQAIVMLQTLADAEVASLRVDSNHTQPAPQTPIVITGQRVNQLLGSDLSPEQMKQLLENVNLEVSLQAGELAVLAPTWRYDLTIPEDVVEEIGRLHGYDQLKPRVPLRSLEPTFLSPIEITRRTMRAQLVAAGSQEILTYNFVDEQLFDKTKQDITQSYAIRNALRPELKRIRTNLLPSLLQHIRPNIRRGHEEFALFELGKTHNKQLQKDSLPIEINSLSFVYAASEKKASQYGTGSPYYHAKLYLDYLLKDTKYQLVSEQPARTSWWAQNIAKLFSDGRRSYVVVDDSVLGVMGEVEPAIKNQFKLPPYVSGFELDVQAVQALQTATSGYLPGSRFPSLTQDITFAIPNETTYEVVSRELALQVTSSDWSIAIEPLDVFAPKETLQTRNITFRLTWTHPARTMNMSEINSQLAAISSKMSQSIGAARVE